MEKPLISVIVPVYNIENYLEVCVQSILCQTYDKMEVLLIDDGSTDQSGERCAQFARADRRVSVFHKDNGGLSDARNHGIDRAKGELLAFVDGDDRIHPKMLAHLQHALAEADADMAVCGFVREANAHPAEDRARDWSDIRRTIYDRDQVIADLNAIGVVAWNKLYRRQLFEGLRYPKGKLHEDEFVIHELVWRCSRIVAIDEPLYYYIQRDSSIVGSMKPQRVYDALEALEGRIAFAQEHQWEEAGAAALRRYCDQCIEYYYGLRDGRYQLDCSFADFFQKKEREMVERYREIPLDVRYRDFGEKPERYERRMRREARVFRAKQTVKRMIGYGGRHADENG